MGQRFPKCERSGCVVEDFKYFYEMLLKKKVAE